ncbi:hypothetical protein TKK_0000295 [Trichogramma kaykai]
MFNDRDNDTSGSRRRLGLEEVNVTATKTFSPENKELSRLPSYASTSKAMTLCNCKYLTKMFLRTARASAAKLSCQQKDSFTISAENSDKKAPVT